MSKSIKVDVEDMRNIIIGKIKFRKCPLCDNDGIEIQAFDDSGNPCASDHPEAMREECQSCDGIGFRQIDCDSDDEN